jgi:hypothetical protein
MVEVGLDCNAPGGMMTSEADMSTHLVHCPEVPKVFAPYPVAVKGAGLVFLSGLHLLYLLFWGSSHGLTH